MPYRSDQLDVLSSILNSYSLRARIYARPSVCGPWQIAGDQAPDGACATFHLLGRGQGWLHTRGQDQPVALRSGDLVMFPGNQWNLLTRDPDLAHLSNPQPASEDGPETRFLCGAIQLEAGARNPIMAALPDVILVRAEEAGPQLDLLTRMMAAEAESQAFGSDVVLDKLADVLFVLAVRHHIVSAEHPRGLLAALTDTRIARALAALHEKPGNAWTVAELARLAGMSRTAFSNRFGALMAQGPIEYLTRWRMQEAERLLTTRKISVAELAERLGYETDAAFRRAFKRVTGHTPGRLRRSSPGRTA